MMCRMKTSLIAMIVVFSLALLSAQRGATQSIQDLAVTDQADSCSLVR